MAAPKPVWIIPPPTTWDVVGQIVCETCQQYHWGVARQEGPRDPVRYRDLTTNCPENEDLPHVPPRVPAPVAPASLSVRPVPEPDPPKPPPPPFVTNPPPPDGPPGPPPPPRGGGR